MPAHSLITDPNIHEPKGITTAGANGVYVSDGAGSGDWQRIFVQGWEDVADTTGSQALGTAVWTDLVNNGLGANSNSGYRLPGKSALWDTSTNRFNFNTASYVLGDTFDIRFDVTFTTTGTNHNVKLRMELADGSGSDYTLDLLDTIVKTAGTYHAVVTQTIYMGNNATLNNPAKVQAYSDSAGNSLVVNGWFIRAIPRNPVFN
jgi:hypothetical protein